MTKLTLISLLIIIFFSACQPASPPQRDASAHSPRYHADSMSTLGRARIFYAEKRDRDAIPSLDSTFRLPACMNPDSRHPDSLTTLEARSLCNRALHELMVTYNILMDYGTGLQHFDSLDNLRIPFMQRYCLRGLYVAKAQMLMPLDRHSEALHYLNLAMKLAETDNEAPEYDSYWSGTAGCTYMGVDTISTRAEHALLRVADITRRTSFRSKFHSHFTARLADIYLHQGRYEDAITLCKEALDHCQLGDQGHYVAAENLTEIYRRLGLYEDALHYSSIVTDAPRRYEVLNNLHGRSYITKAAVLADMQRIDEALIALQQADSCFDRTDNKYFQLQVTLERAHLLSNLPDSLDASLHIFASYEGQIPAHRQAFYHYYYGSALVRAEQYARAIPLLERAVPESENISERLMAYEAARQLTECYHRAGRHARLAEFLPHYQVLADSMASDAKIRQLASANIRYETEKKEQENRTLAAEVILKDSRLRTTFLIGALCLLVAGSIIVWGVMRNRALTLRHRLNEQEKESAATLLREKETQLHSIIENRLQLYNRNLDLLRQLSDIQAASNYTCDLDLVMESLQKSLFSKEDTERFRRNFSAVYPSALNRLRNRHPELTRNEELFCMLVMLKQNNEEMAHTLGISVRSVSKIRYRLRIKLELPEGADVDKEIRDIME